MFRNWPAQWVRRSTGGREGNPDDGNETTAPIKEFLKQKRRSLSDGQISERAAKPQVSLEKQLY